MLPDTVVFFLIWSLFLLKILPSLYFLKIQHFSMFKSFLFIFLGLTNLLFFSQAKKQLLNRTSLALNLSDPDPYEIPLNFQLVSLTLHVVRNEFPGKIRLTLSSSNNSQECNESVIFCQKASFGDNQSELSLRLNVQVRLDNIFLYVDTTEKNESAVVGIAFFLNILQSSMNRFEGL